MAISMTSLTSGGSASSANSYATASISPSASKIILLGVANPRGAGSPNIPTVTGASMTWTQVATYLDSSASLRRITLFRSVNASPGSGALTIDFAGQSQDACMWSVTEVTGADTGGTNGSNAIVQTATGEANGTVTGVTATLGAFSNASNATFGIVRHNSNGLAITEGSGFTELSEVAITNNRYQTQYKATNDTTVDWSWSSTSLNATAIAAEIKIAGGGTSSASPMFFSTGGVTLG